MSIDTPSRSRYRNTLLTALVVAAVAAVGTDADAQTIQLQPPVGVQASSVAEYSPGVQARLRTSTVGLVEVASPVPGGGIIVDLGGGFESVMVAVVDPGGVLHSDCAHSHADNNSATRGKHE